MEKPKTINQRVKSWLVLSAKLFAWASPFLLTLTTHAADEKVAENLGWATVLLDGVIGNTLGIIGTLLLIVLGSISSLVSGIMSSFINQVLVGGGNSLIFGSQIETAWLSVLQGTNVLLFLALGIMSIMIITGMQNYNLKKAISGLIYAILMANFSFQIVKLLVLLGDALRNGIAAGLMSTTGGEDPILKLSNAWIFVFGPVDISATDNSGFMLFLASMISAAVMVISAYALVRIGLILIERIVRLSLYIVFAPLVFILQLFPGVGLDSLSKDWWRDLVKWVLVLPISYFLIAVASILLPTDISISREMFKSVTGEGSQLWSSIILALASALVVIAAGDVGKLLKLDVSAPTKFLGNALSKGLTNNGKNAATLAGQNVASGLGLTRAYEGIKQKYNLKPIAERVKENRERLGKIKDEVATSQAVGKQSSLQQQYEAELKSFQRKNAQKYFSKDFDQLSESERDTLENLSEFKNSKIAKQLDANKKILSGESGKAKTGYGEKELTADDAKSEFAKLMSLRTTLADKGKDTGEVDLKLRGLLDHIKSKALGGGSAAVPWKRLGNDVFFNEENKGARNAAKSVGANFPKQLFTYSPKEETEYDSRGKALKGREAVDLGKDLSSRSSDQMLRNELETLKTRVANSSAPKEVKDAIEKIGDAKDASLISAISKAKSISNPTLLRELDQSQGVRDKINRTLSSNFSSAQKQADIETLLKTLASGGNPAVSADVQLVAKAIVETGGDMVRHAATTAEVVEGIQNTTIASDVNDIIDKASAIKGSGSAATLDAAERKVGYHQGYVSKLSQLDPKTRQSIADQAQSVLINLSSPTYIDPTSSLSTAEDSLSATDLMAKMTPTEQTAYETQLAAEHQLVKDAGITTDSISGKLIDISDIDNYSKLTVAQRRDIAGKLFFSNRAITDRGGAPLAPKKSSK